MSDAREAVAQRLRYPDERRRPWLCGLLDAQAVLDAGVAAAVAREGALGRVPACGPGCAACCQRHLIPVTPLEIQGLCWYAERQLSGPLRREVAERLARPRHEDCPFLVRGACAAYPVRPLACRQFIVFGTACAPGEDVFSTRRHDVLDPVPEAKRSAAALLLPHCGFGASEARDQALAEQYLRGVSQLLLGCDWSPLARSLLASSDAG